MADAGFVDAASWWQRPQHEWRPGERLLACAAAAVADLREAVRRELGYTCSAGIAHTKLMAKLCSGCDGKGRSIRLHDSDPGGLHIWTQSGAM